MTNRRNTLVAVPMLLLLVACAGPQWSISKVRVNPQPLSGVETVSPVVLVASPAGARQDVNVDVEFTRSGNFQGAILWKIAHQWVASGGFRYSHERTVQAPSRHDNFILLSAICTRIEPVGQEPSVRLDGLSNSSGSGCDFCQAFSVSGVTAANALVNIKIVSQTNGNNPDYVSWAAPKQLQITCLRDSPIN